MYKLKCFAITYVKLNYSQIYVAINTNFLNQLFFFSKNKMYNVFHFIETVKWRPKKIEMKGRYFLYSDVDAIF